MRILTILRILKNVAAGLSKKKKRNNHHIAESSLLLSSNRIVNIGIWMVWWGSWHKCAQPHTCLLSLMWSATTVHVASLLCRYEDSMNTVRHIPDGGGGRYKRKSYIYPEGYTAESHWLNLAMVWPNFRKVKNGILEAVGNWYIVKGPYIIPEGRNSLELRLKIRCKYRLFTRLWIWSHLCDEK